MAALYENGDGEWVPVPVPVLLDRVMRGALLNALAYTDGNQRLASELLGITPRVMSYQLRAYGIVTTGTSGQLRRQGRRLRHAR